MCNTNMLATLQTEVLNGVKIDSADKTDKTTMELITEQIMKFTAATVNHTDDALEDFKNLEQLIARERRSLTLKVSSAKKELGAEERRADADRKAELKRIEKEEASDARRALLDIKKARKSALQMLNKLLKKPKSPIAGKTDVLVKKWGLIGAKTNFAPTKKANNQAIRELKKAQKEEAVTARKLANAGKPKNGAYSAFCSWFTADVDEIDEAGFVNKRDYNKHIWTEGMPGKQFEMTDGGDYASWDDYKKSKEAPWNQDK
tara:strand:+ start:64 stop:846 length:783 start_codon:yes stop_codon:yes gene_type:complete